MLYPRKYGRAEITEQFIATYPGIDVELIKEAINEYLHQKQFYSSSSFFVDVANFLNFPEQDHIFYDFMAQKALGDDIMGA